MIHWASRQDFAEYMHDCYGDVLDFDVLPIAPRDKVKHPWNEHLLIDRSMQDSNQLHSPCCQRLRREMVPMVFQFLRKLLFEIRFLTHLS